MVLTTSRSAETSNQQDAGQSVKERMQMKTLWGKTPEKIKEGINLLQVEMKNQLSSLRRAENMSTRCKMREQKRSRFFKLTRTKQAKNVLKAYLIHTDIQRDRQTTLPPDVPLIHPSEHQLDISLEHKYTKPRFTQWRSAAEAWWASQPPGYLKTLEGQAQCKATKALSGAAEQANGWLWVTK